MVACERVSYRDLETSGVLMPVIDLNIRYRRPFRFDDEVTMQTTASLSAAVVSFSQQNFYQWTVMPFMRRAW